MIDIDKYPLVNCTITIDNYRKIHCLWWENSRLMGMFNGYIKSTEESPCIIMVKLTINGHVKSTAGMFNIIRECLGFPMSALGQAGRSSGLKTGVPGWHKISSVQNAGPAQWRRCSRWKKTIEAQESMEWISWYFFRKIMLFSPSFDMFNMFQYVSRWNSDECFTANEVHRVCRLFSFWDVGSDVTSQHPHRPDKGYEKDEQNTVYQWWVEWNTTIQYYPVN